MNYVDSFSPTISKLSPKLKHKSYDLKLNFVFAVENVAFRKESWINNKRQFKRHVRNRWMHGHAARAVDGNFDQSLHSCTVLDNFYVEKPIWMVDLGRKAKISGIVMMTWQGKGQGQINGKESLYVV
jgi:hypothetical protein